MCRILQKNNSGQNKVCPVMPIPTAHFRMRKHITLSLCQLFLLSVQAPLFQDLILRCPEQAWNVERRQDSWLSADHRVWNGDFSQPVPLEGLKSYNNLPDIEEVLGCRAPTVHNILWPCRNKWAQPFSFSCHYLLKVATSENVYKLLTIVPRCCLQLPPRVGHQKVWLAFVPSWHFVSRRTRLHWSDSQDQLSKLH